MPTYEYECTKCERVFELFQSITAKTKRKIPTDCAKCNNSAPVIRRIGIGAGVIFKGSGFYQTDYRSESYKKGAKAEKEAAESKSSKDGDSKKSESGKKGETTPSKKTEPKTEKKKSPDRE